MTTTADPQRTRMPRPVIPLALTYLAVALNMTIATVALPTLSVEFTATADELVWIVNSTPMVAAATILIAGAVGDRIGRRRILVLGVVVFLLSAVLSGMVTSIGQLIALRGLTGLGSALAMPAAMALTFDVTDGTAQRTAVGIMGSTQAIGALIGPILGGAALVAFGWHAAFWSVVPLLLAALVLNWWWLPTGRPDAAAGRSLDVPGAILTGVVGTALLYAVVTAAGKDLSGSGAKAMAALVIAAVSLIALVWWERRAPQPLFVGSLLRRPGFWIPTLAVFAVQFTLGGLLFLNTQYVQLVLGFSALGAGLFLTPALLMWTGAAASAGRTAARFGVRKATVAGLAAGVLGYVIVAFGGRQPLWPVFVVGLVLTGCLGVVPALMTHTAVSNYSDERRGVGSAINGIAIRFGLAFGVAAYGSLLAVIYAGALAGGPELPAALAAQSQQSLGAALQVAGQLGGSAGAALAEAARDAFVAGFLRTLLVAAAVLTGLAVLIRFRLPEPRRRKP